MANPDFSTTKIDKVYPGLDLYKGVVDQSGSIDTSALSTAIGLGSIALDTGMKIHRENALDVAEENARRNAEDYLAGSPTYQALLNQEEAIINNEISMTNPGATEQIDRLYQRQEELARKKANAVNQGRMSLQELSYQETIDDADIANRYPAHRAEARQRRELVYAELGLRDFQQYDASLDKARADAENKRMETIYKMIEDNPGLHTLPDPRSASYEEVMNAYYEVFSKKHKADSITYMLKSLKEGEELNYNYITNKFFQGSTPTDYMDNAYNTFTSEAYKILDNPEYDFNSQQRLMNDSLQKIENYYLNEVNTLFGNSSDIRVTTYREQVKAMFTSARKDLNNIQTKEDLKKYIDNQKSIQQAIVDIDDLKNYGNIDKKINLVSATLNLSESLLKSQLITSPEEQKILQDRIARIFMKLSGDLDQKLTPYEMELITDPEGVNSNIAKQIMSGTIKDPELQGVVGNTIRNYLKETNGLDINEDVDKVLEKNNNIIKGIINNPEGDWLKDTNNFASIDKTFETQQALINQSMASYVAENKVELAAIKVQESTGKRYSSDPILNAELVRMNEYAQAKSIFTGKDINTILNEDFDFLSTQERPTQTNSDAPKSKAPRPDFTPTTDKETEAEKQAQTIKKEQIKQDDLKRLSVTEMMQRIATVESNNNPNAVSPKGARGTYQIMPATAKDPGFGVTPIDLDTASEEEQTRFATEYYSSLVEYYKGDVEKALAAYNMGYAKLDNLIDKYPLNWKYYIPKETKDYLKKIKASQ